MPPRIFKYAQHTLPDPSSQFSIEDVRRHLAAYLPELAQATHTENALPDGTVEITFHKQVTTKG